MNKNNLILKIFFITTLLITVLSCSGGGNFRKSSSKKAFISHYEKQDLDKSREALKQDLADVDSLIEDAAGYSMYFGFSMSAGPAKSDSTVKIETKEAVPFSLTVDEAAAAAEFDTLFSTDGKPNTVDLEQEFITPNSTINAELPASKIKGAETESFITNIYSGGKKISKNKIGLKSVDSATVLAKYKFPTNVDRLEFPYSKQDSIIIAGQEVDLRDAEDNSAEFYLPQNLYQKLIGFQAYDESGKLMDSNSSSAFPVMMVRKSILNNLKVTKNALIEAQKSQTEKDLVAALNKIPETVFKEKNRLYEMKKRFIEEKKASKRRKNNKKKDSFDEELDAIKSIIADFADILAPEEQLVEMGFSNKIKSLIFYFGKDYKVLTKTGRAVTYKDEYSGYNSFLDQKTKKYGIIDSLGNVVVEPAYKDIIYSGNRFFLIDSKHYYLEPNSNKLIDFGDKNFESKIDNKMAVFTDSTNHAGVMDYSKNIIVPFEYRGISAIKNIFAVSKTLRGREFFDILDKNAKSITGRIAGYRYIGDTGKVVIQTMDDTYGIMDGDGKYLLKPQTYKLEGTDSGLVIFSSDENFPEPFSGIMDSNGKIILKPANIQITDASKTLIVTQNQEDNRYQILDYGGKPAFSGTFKDVASVYDQFAIIETGETSSAEDFKIINRAGKTVADILPEYGSLLKTKTVGGDTIFEFENKTLNSKNFK